MDSKDQRLQLSGILISIRLTIYLQTSFQKMGSSMTRTTSLIVSLEGGKMVKTGDQAVASVDSGGLVASAVDLDLHSIMMISSAMAEVLAPLHSVQATSVEDWVALPNQWVQPQKQCIYKII